jgi:hypothetical protein
MVNLVDLFSVAIGSVVILTLLGAIAVDGIEERLTHKRKTIQTINNRWQKIRVQV